MSNLAAIFIEVDKYGFSELESMVRKYCEKIYGQQQVEELKAGIEYFNSKGKGVVSLSTVDKGVPYNYVTMARDLATHIGETVGCMTAPGLMMDGKLVVKPRVITW